MHKPLLIIVCYNAIYMSCSLKLPSATDVHSDPRSTARLEKSMTKVDIPEDLADGSAHTIPCQSERHVEDPEGPMLYVRYLTEDRVWLLHCWSRLGCSYGEITRLLGIEADADRTIRRKAVRHMVAAYDNFSPGERPRMVFHSWRDVAESPPTREELDHREAEIRGSATRTQLMLWAPEDVDRTDRTLVVVGTEEAAMSLMRAGVDRQGLVPVTWYRAVKRLEEDTGSVDRVDWSRVQGRRVVFWPANSAEACTEMHRAAKMAAVAGATELEVLDPRGSGLSEGDDAASLVDRDAIMSALGRMKVLPGLPGDDADSGASLDGKPDPEPEPGTDTTGWAPDVAGILKPGVENATDVAMAVRVLREHGHRMVLASRPEGSDPPLVVHWRASTGMLERRPAELEIALWRSRDRYMGELLTLRESGRISPEEFRECVRYVNGVASATGRRAVIENLGLAHRILEEHAAVPAGLRFATSEAIDSVTRYLGAPNGVIDLDSGRLLSGTESRRALVSGTIPDSFEPEARDPHVDRLTAHMSEEDREHLLNAFGFALRGVTADRVYILEGGQSRTVLLNCVRLALGPRYSGAAPLGLLLKGYHEREDTTPPPELHGFVGPRILAGSAPAGSGSLDPGLLGELTLSDAITARSFTAESLGDIEPTATMFVAVEPDVLHGFDDSTAHLLKRVRLLSYPDSAAVDPAISDRAGRSSTLRQALVALLVRRCAAMTGPPDHIPHPAPPRPPGHPATAADDWLLEAMEVTGNREDRTSSSALWEAARSAPGSGTDPDLAWGMSRRSLTTRAIQLQGLDRTRSVRIGDAVLTGWTGVRLVRGGDDEV